MNHGLECLRINPTIWFKIKQINKQEFKNYAKNSAHYVKNSAQPRGAWPEPHLKYTQIGTQIVLQGRVLSFPQLHLTKIFLQKCHQYCECKMYFAHRNVHEKIYALLIGWKRVHSSCDMCTKLRHERKLQIILKNYYCLLTPNCTRNHIITYTNYQAPENTVFGFCPQNTDLIL